MNREQYQIYVDHFNHKRYDALTSYFTSDITVEYFDNASPGGDPPRTLRGPGEFAAMYKNLHAHTREVIELGDFIAQDRMMVVELYTEFHTFADPLDGNAGYRKGGVKVMTNWVVYNLDDSDKMKRIRILHFRNHDPSMAKYK